MTTEKQRIWELDAIRGISILGMVAIHIPINISIFADVELTLPWWYHFLKDYGYLFFVLISGICVTLASRSFKRGIAVFGAGLLVSYVTLFMDLILGFDEMRIWFGILHMLGACMMLYPIFKRLPAWALLIVGIVFCALGIWFETLTVPVDYLFPIGLCPKGVYTGGDYFPLFPGIGWFLIGAWIGKTLYRNKQSLLPKVNSKNPIISFFCACGKHSLIIYLLHQPVITLITVLFMKLNIFH